MHILSRIVVSLIAAWGIVMVPCAAQAQTGASGAEAYPTKLIRIVNPFTAGGPADVIARLVAEQLQERWGQSVIVETKLGAGGNIAMEYTARAPADGYTLVLAATGTMAINQFLFRNMRFDAIRDFAPITLIASIDNVLVVPPDLPVKTVQEFVSYAKANPGKIAFGSPGVGSQPHLAGEMFRVATRTDIVHIPYKGASEAITALLGGQISMQFGQVSAVLPYVSSGKLRALGIASKKRSALMPEVPTVAEQSMPGFESASIYALLAPKGTPGAVIAKLHAEVTRILRLPQTKDKMTQMGIDIVASTPEQLADVMRSEAARYGKIVAEAGIRPE